MELGTCIDKSMHAKSRKDILIQGDCNKVTNIFTCVKRHLFASEFEKLSEWKERNKTH